MGDYTAIGAGSLRGDIENMQSLLAVPLIIGAGLNAAR